VGELLVTLARHNVRPNHLHMMIEAPGFHKLVTSLYPEGDVFLSSDAVFGVKKSLVVVSERIRFPRAPFVYFCYIYFSS
jgi:protocatechuate 3,4-dioxygenase beta subunit